MTETSHPIFRTKTGVCELTPEYIVLSRQGLRGKSAELLIGRSILPVLIFHAGLGIILVGYAIFSIQIAEYFIAFFAALTGGFLLRGAYRSRNVSATPIVARRSIRSVVAMAPVPPMTRGYFVVTFVVANKEKTRMIILPGVLQGGAEEYQRAIAAMESAGIKVARS
jgi:hypothetical protein